GQDAGGSGVNLCCPLCEPAPHIAIRCSSAGERCGDVLSLPPFLDVWCRLNPFFYDAGFCQPRVEGDLWCQFGGCLDTTCTSSGECGSGFFCGRDAGGAGVDLCCPLCQ